MRIRYLILLSFVLGGCIILDNLNISTNLYGTYDNGKNRFLTLDSSGRYFYEMTEFGYNSSKGTWTSKNGLLFLKSDLQRPNLMVDISEKKDSLNKIYLEIDDKLRFKLYFNINGTGKYSLYGDKVIPYNDTINQLCFIYHGELLECYSIPLFKDYTSIKIKVSVSEDFKPIPIKGYIVINDSFPINRTGVKMWGNQLRKKYYPPLLPSE